MPVSFSLLPFPGTMFILPLISCILGPVPSTGYLCKGSNLSFAVGSWSIFLLPKKPKKKSVGKNSASGKSRRVQTGQDQGLVNSAQNLWSHTSDSSTVFQEYKVTVKVFSPQVSDFLSGKNYQRLWQLSFLISTAPFQHILCTEFVPSDIFLALLFLNSSPVLFIL